MDSTNRYIEEGKVIKCSHAKDCGACTYANVEYEKELSKKQKEMEELFKGICEVQPITGMFRPVNYRNKVHVVVDVDKNGKLITGNYKEYSHSTVAIDKCMLEDSKASKIIVTLRDLFKKYKYKAYNEDKKTGWIRHILIRRGQSTKEIMVVLVTADDFFYSKKDFLADLLKAHPEINTVVQNVNGRKTSMVLGDKNKVLYGKGYIEDVLCGCRFRISPSSFYQINSAQTEKLYKCAINMAKLKKSDILIDAYSGIGTIGMCAAGKVKKVFAVELNQEACEDAKVNVTLNNIKNVQTINGDAGEFLVEYTKNNRADVVIMDPPRSGSTPEFLNSIVKSKPDRVVYISCNPETQVRDLKVLMKGGYKVVECRPYDMFPKTGHVETVVLLSQRKADDYIEVELKLDELDATSAETKATYEEIKKYVAEHNEGMKVSNLYIAQVKRKCGIELGENFNLPKSQDSKQPQCPQEKEKAIRDALEHFGMI